MSSLCYNPSYVLIAVSFMERKIKSDNLERFDMKMWMKRVIQMLGILFLLLILVNIVEPLLHKNVSKEQEEKIQAMNYESSEMGTERIICVDDNEEALLWRLRMINAAEEKIILSTFDLRADESGTDILSALYMAANRGVKVQILVDGIYQILYLRDSELFQALCAHENVEARFYNVPDLKNVWRLNYRMHDKYILIDDKMYLLGGRNTNDIFLGDYQKGKNVDREILVYQQGATPGKSFCELQEYFDTIWKEECVKKAKPDSRKNWDKEYEMLAQRYESLNNSYEIDYHSWEKETIPANQITLLHNGTAAGRKEPLILKCLEELMAKGEDVFIQTPYVICNGAMYDVLENVTESASVSILLNAVEKGSNPWGCTDYLNNKDRIRETGVTIDEVMNKQALHTKTVVVDDRISVVGSYNYDMRSTYLDTELMLVIDSEELNAHIRGMCASYEKKSIQVQPDGTEIVGEEYKAKTLTRKKERFYGILKVVIRPFRHLL